MFYFTADQHFGHQNIIEQCSRPFKDTAHMDKIMIESWNDTVKGKDVIVVLGDLSFSHDFLWVKLNILDKLKGNKILLKGNHDHWFKKGRRHLYNKVIDGCLISCCHYPFRSWKNSIHGSWNLHGHSHGKLAPLPGQLDVGVDVANMLLGEYRPFSFDEVAYWIQAVQEWMGGVYQETKLMQGE